MEVDFTVNLYIKGIIDLENVYQVKDEIQYLEDSVREYKTKILMLVSSTPVNILDSDWKEQPIDWLFNQAKEYFILIEEKQKELNLLYYWCEFKNWK